MRGVGGWRCRLPGWGRDRQLAGLGQPQGSACPSENHMQKYPAPGIADHRVTCLLGLGSPLNS